MDTCRLRLQIIVVEQAACVCICIRGATRQRKRDMHRDNRGRTARRPHSRPARREAARILGGWAR